MSQSRLSVCLAFSISHASSWKSRRNDSSKAINFLAVNWLIDYQETCSLLGFPTRTLHRLRHLALDVRPGSSTSPIFSILALLKSSASPLSSLAIRTPELKSPSSRSFIKDLLHNHAHTLTKLSFFDCTIEFDSISDICKACIHLEQMNLPLPVKDIVSTYFSFTALFSQKSSLQDFICDCDILFWDSPHHCRRRLPY